MTNLPIPSNKKLADAFHDIWKDRISNEKTRFSAFAYKKAMKTIEGWPTKITSSSDLEGVPGIGKKIKAKIDEYFATEKIAVDPSGSPVTSPNQVQKVVPLDVTLEPINIITNSNHNSNHNSSSASKLLTSGSQINIRPLSLSPKSVSSIESLDIIPIETKTKTKKDILADFQTIYGVGPKQAKKWYDAGLRSIEDIDVKTCNMNQQIGLKYREELLERIPRSEIMIVEQLIMKWLSILDQINGRKIIRTDIVGSYRRGNPDSGDIDILITSEVPTTSTLIQQIRDFFLACPSSINDIINVEPYRTYEGENNLFTDIMACGLKKVLAISQIPGYPHRRIDLLFIDRSKYFYSLLYFTGSKTHNIEMRLQAIDKGWTLSENSLKIDATGEELPANSEADIFRYLEMPYKEPVDRI